MPVPANLVHQTSTSTGTGNFTLAAVNGKQSFNNAFGTGGTDLFDYFISNRDAAEYERGTGHLSASNTLVRDTVIESTNANAAVNFSLGTKDVINDVPAANQGIINGVQLITATGTYTPTPGTIKVLVFGQAAGGGSGGIGATAGTGASGGGGAGETRVGVFSVSAPVSVTIGAAGIAGTAVPAAGGDAADATFGAFMTCKGGKGGGTSTGNTFGTNGALSGSGSGGIQFPPTGLPFNRADLGTPIKGGSSLFGMGGAVWATTTLFTLVVGPAGEGYGGGAAPSVENSSSTAVGNVGAPGCFLVIEFA